MLCWNSRHWLLHGITASLVNPRDAPQCLHFSAFDLTNVLLRRFFHVYHAERRSLSVTWTTTKRPVSSCALPWSHATSVFTRQTGIDASGSALDCSAVPPTPVGYVCRTPPLCPNSVRSICCRSVVHIIIIIIVIYLLKQNSTNVVNYLWQ